MTLPDWLCLLAAFVLGAVAEAWLDRRRRRATSELLRRIALEGFVLRSSPVEPDPVTAPKSAGES